jgi:hypothetical protein
MCSSPDSKAKITMETNQPKRVNVYL